MRRLCDMRCPGFRVQPGNEIAARIGGAGWGLFLLWIGVSFVLDVGWGVGLLGVGILIFSMQMLRRGFGLEFEGFWVLAGCGFTLAGIWELEKIEISLLPILLMIFGVFVLASALRGTRE